MLGYHVTVTVTITVTVTVTVTCNNMLMTAFSLGVAVFADDGWICL